jgi:hypothetical protein
MSTATLLTLLLAQLAVGAGMFVCFLALHRWQRGIWRRERGEPTGGFPIEPGQGMATISGPNVSNILQIPLPGGSGAARTGAVQFRDDWPGLFVRGDDAILLAFSIRQLQSRLASTDDAQISGALSRLTKIADLIDRDVQVRR